MVVRLLFSFSYTIFIHNFSLWFRFVCLENFFFLHFFPCTLRERVSESTQREKNEKNKVQSESREWNTIQAPHRPITPSSRFCARDFLDFTSMSYYCLGQCWSTFYLWFMQVGVRWWTMLARSSTFNASWKQTFDTKLVCINDRLILGIIKWLSETEKFLSHWLMVLTSIDWRTSKSCKLTAFK